MRLDDNTPVYRIIGIEAFLSLLINKTERYVRPIDFWQDTFEGYMLHQLDTKASRRQVLERLYSISDKDTDLMIRNLSKLLRSRYSCYAQCWSTIRDSDAMWRIYAYNNRAIQLKSSVSNIQKMICILALRAVMSISTFIPMLTTGDLVIFHIGAKFQRSQIT